MFISIFFNVHFKNSDAENVAIPNLHDMHNVFYSNSDMSRKTFENVTKCDVNSNLWSLVDRLFQTNVIQVIVYGQKMQICKNCKFLIAVNSIFPWSKFFTCHS